MSLGHISISMSLSEIVRGHLATPLLLVYFIGRLDECQAVFAINSTSSVVISVDAECRNKHKVIFTSEFEKSDRIRSLHMNLYRYTLIVPYALLQTTLP